MQAGKIWALTAALASVSLGAAAADFDFESVSPPFHTATLVPDGYAGAHWTGFVLRRTNEMQGAGYVMNGTTMALVSEDLAPTIRFDAPTVFEGAFMGNSARSGSVVTYDLYLGPVLAASSGPIGLNASFLASVYGGPIDQIVFHVAASNLFSLDSITATAAVPEPQTVALMLLGLGLVAGVAQRRRG